MMSLYSSEIDNLKGINWEDCKEQFVTRIRLDSPLEQAKQKMQEYIKQRDIVDNVCYHLAITRIFPADYFNLDAKIEGNLAETAKGGYTFTAKWYTFIVTQRTNHLPTGSEEPQECKIAIKAPGSRTLTSDIDTSIHTTFVGVDKRSFFKYAPAIVKAEMEAPDFEGRVTNNVINGFYEISEQLFNSTSSSKRDSNAYADTIAKDKENYPKFLHEEENNPLVYGERLFSEEQFTTAFKKYKYRKHVQEMAASLFSLRDSLEAQEWQAFKDLVKEQLKEILKEEFSELPKQQYEAYISICQQDYDAIFQEVEDIYNTHSKALKGKRRELRGSRLLEPPADIKIAALNRLYVEYLEKCTACYEKILALKSKKEPLKNELEAKKQELEAELNELEKLDKNSSHRRVLALVKELQTSCASLEESCQKLKASLQQNILETAQLQVEHHLSQILASTFAYEAYVCRSAVYHVVNGQSGKDVPISQQTLLGSALQQVGFKLLHTKELTDKGKTPPEVAYYTAKYGQRVFNLIFSGHKAGLDGEAIRRLAQGRKMEGLPQFTYLKSEQVRHNAYLTFGQKELALLNGQAKIIQHIKSNPAISDAEKPKKTVELLGSEGQKNLNFEREKELYLSISAKLIGLVCASRLKHKGYLWGQNPSIPLRHKAEEKEMEGSTSVISPPVPLQISQLPEVTPGGNAAVDEHHQLGQGATNLVLGTRGGNARVSHMTQQSYSQSAVVAGASEETAQKLAAGVFGNNPK